jgi:hypothetical protein
MVNFLIGTIMNAGVTAALWYGLRGNEYLYTFGIVMVWILVSMLSLANLCTISEAAKKELTKNSHGRLFELRIFIAALWDVPIVYLLIISGRPILSAFYVLLHIYYYGIGLSASRVHRQEASK